MKDLISALNELHRHDILHLDIKPENIIFESDAEDARIKLTDFGLSKVSSFFSFLIIFNLTTSYRSFIMQQKVVQGKIQQLRN